MAGTKRVLIFIVAYNAEKTIASVLSRIPVARLPADAEVLIIDDCSADKTFPAARESQGNVAGLKVTILHNPVNQGYGGNQKLGYEYAIEHGFDVVALLHGDGQYAPEKLPELIQPVLAGEAEACFGSRMMPGGTPIRNGMPVYKYVGNRILTAFQNRLLGLRLSEFHSGYRVYAVEALKSVPFSYNTNDFHFDTEIIIQFAAAGFRIRELPIPTYYGDEICHVNGLGYAWNVCRETLASRIHRMGILYQRKYDVRAIPVYDLKDGYDSSHTRAIRRVPPGCRVLDLACGPGFVAEKLREKGCHVIGVDQENQPADRFDRFVRQDLDRDEFPGDIGPVDWILALDCLEHLSSPEALLARIRAAFYSDKTRLLVTVPNIGFVVNRWGLLVGQFNYGATGILDLTHKRLFTFKTLTRLLEQEGYRITDLRGIPAPFPKALGNGFWGATFLHINRFLVMLWRGMFSYQIYAEAEITPTVIHLLRRTVSHSEALAQQECSRPG